MNQIRLLCLLGIVLLTGGCSTIATKTDERWGVAYSGTKCASSRMKQAWSYSGIAGFVSSFDVLFSAIADTMILPIDLLVPKQDYKYTPRSKERDMPCRPL